MSETSIRETTRATTFGLVIPDITNPFFASLVQAVQHAARERGIGILIVDSGNDADAERDSLRTLVDRRVDAVLISAVHTTGSLEALSQTARELPTIQIDRVIDESLPFVRANQSEPIARIVDHLRSTERAHLAFIGQRSTISTSIERENAFVRLMAASAPDEPLRLVKEGMSPQSGSAAARQIMTAWPETDAIICANDIIAVGVLQALGTHSGRREVAVSGFDDTLIARMMRITSVRQPVEQIAEVALTAAADVSPGSASLANGLAVELASSVEFRFTTA
jgi:LacI family transcriptional regulator